MPQFVAAQGANEWTAATLKALANEKGCGKRGGDLPKEASRKGKLTLCRNVGIMYNATRPRTFAAITQLTIKMPPATKLSNGQVTNGAGGVKLIMTDIPSPVKRPPPSFHLTEYTVKETALQGIQPLPLAVHPFKLYRRWMSYRVLEEKRVKKRVKKQCCRGLGRQPMVNRRTCSALAGDTGHQKTKKPVH